MKTHRGTSLCPYCGRQNTAHATADDQEPPKPGDFSYCAYCHEISVFKRDGRLRVLRRGEAAEAMASANRLADAIRREILH